MGDSNQPIADLEAWEAPEPAADFADRVLLRIQDEFVIGTHTGQVRNQPSSTIVKKPNLWITAGAAALIASVAVAATMFLVMRPSARSTTDVVSTQANVGAHSASTSRTTMQIGNRAIAVAEAGAILSWNVTDTGTTAIRQTQGAVFYRVDRIAGAPFVVTTPHGQVTVTGTCFSVDVASDVTSVVVREGSVNVGSGSGQLNVIAGDSVYFNGTHIHEGRLPTVRDGSGNRTETASDKCIAGSTFAQPVAVVAPKRIKQDADTLKLWAKTCKVVADLPPFDLERPKDLPGWVNYAEKLGATPQEVVVVKETFEELEKDAYRLLREAYETFTGNKAPPEMSVDEVIFEIIRTGGYNDAPEVYQSIAEERAGLKEPPSKDAKMGPVEHLLRSILVQGDLYEAALAKKLGRERARELREKNQGWPGAASEWEGCPEVK